METVQQRSAQLTEISTDSTDAAELSRKDINFLGMLVDPTEFTFGFPPFYVALFSLLTAFKSKIERFAIGIPRGFAKTTFLKLLCVWYILFSDRKFILIVGAAEKLATNTLADICDMLSSRNIRTLFGNWQFDIEEDTKEQKVFTFRGRTIILKAVGAGTAVRGINRKSARPDVIILDDVQKREDSENKELADDLLKWILGTLMKARSNSGCTYIYVGNMYPQNCILQALKNNSQWTSLVVGGLLSDGTSLWEELRPAEELIAEYQSDLEMGHPEIFISEILNSTDIAPPSGIDINKIPVLPGYYQQLLDDGEAEGSFIIIDPSSGKKTGDDCAICHYDVIDSKPIFTELATGTFSPLETIEAAINMGLRKNTRLIGVEGVAYQSTLLFWFNHYCNENGISGFEFVELSPKGQAKNNRIKRGLLSLIAGEIYLGSAVRSTVMAQIVEWNPMIVNNKDDIIDPIGYVDELVRDYGDLMIKNTFDEDNFAGTSYHMLSADVPF
jgi:hypothetical protein